MLDLLPPGLADILRDRYISGVATAETLFDENRADEDAVTGALGQSLSMASPVFYQDQGNTYSVQVSYRKIRGRGRDAPERLYGADGIFQIALIDFAGRLYHTKGLPFQSKIDWRGRNSKLAAQAFDIQQSLGAGIVIDYTETGYRACPTSAAVRARGNHKQVERENELRSLGQILGKDFLECRVGKMGLYFDPERERFVQGDDVLPPAHALTTVVRSSRGTFSRNTPHGE